MKRTPVKSTPQTSTPNTSADLHADNVATIFGAALKAAAMIDHPDSTEMQLSMLVVSEMLAIIARRILDGHGHNEIEVEEAQRRCALQAIDLVGDFQGSMDCESNESLS